MGSLLAIIVYFRNDLFSFINNKNFLIKILIGTIPIIPVGYILYHTGLIHQLRNYYFHDFENWEKSAQDKLLIHVHEFFQLTIGKDEPDDDNEWINIQLAVLFKTTENQIELAKKFKTKETVIINYFFQHSEILKLCMRVYGRGDYEIVLLCVKP